MPKTRHVNPSRAIGRTLRGWREDRGLTLRSVAQHSQRYPEPVGFDYLSRLERGQLMPSVPKLATLANVYGRPISELVDLYEIEELRRLVPKKANYDLCRQLGIEALQKGEVTKALACFLGAIDAAKREGALGQRLAVACNNAGNALLKGGRYETARRYLEEGLRQVESPLTRARLLDNLANVHYQLDDLHLAELLSREACALAVDEPALLITTQATRAMTLVELKRPQEGEALMRATLAAYERIGDEIEAIRQRYNLAHCLVLQSKYDEGLKLAREAVAQAGQRHDPVLHSTSQYFLGRCLFLAGMKDECGGPLEAAIRLAGEEPNRNSAFHAAYYLMLLAGEREDEEREAFYKELAQSHRFRLEQLSDEARAFDSLTEEKPRRTKAESASHATA
jgi:tetratricopeptide (TPR) repeat protein